MEHYDAYVVGKDGVFSGVAMGCSTLEDAERKVEESAPSLLGHYEEEHGGVDKVVYFKCVSVKEVSM